MRPEVIFVDYTSSRVLTLYINLAAFVGLPVLAFVIFVLSWNASFIGSGATHKETKEEESGRASGRAFDGVSEEPAKGSSGRVSEGVSKGKSAKVSKSASKGASEEPSEGVLVINVLVVSIRSLFLSGCEKLYRFFKERNW